MLVVRFDAILFIRAVASVVICATTLATTVCAQSGSRNGVPGGLGDRLRGPEQRTARQFYQENGPVISRQDALPVAEVRIVGSETYTDSQVRSHIQTRPGRPYDSEQIQTDVRALMSSGMFHDVRTFQEQSDRGISVTFQVFERPTIRKIKYLGNKKIKDRVLKRESGLQVGESLNLYTVHESQKKLERFYHEKGFPKAKVEIVEGNRPQDRNVVFIINEGQLQRVLNTEFVGNQFVNSRRLKTKIETKRGYLWFVKGRFNRAKLDEDVEKLTQYYRSFGFFRARVGREFDDGESGKWVSVRFVIDEGPRYVVRSVSFVGVSKFDQQDLSRRLDLQAGDHFHIGELNKDVGKLKDFYGHYGYIFADIQAEPRFLEEPGQLDLIYDVKEGQVARVRNINVKITGDNPHTSKETVWPRIDMLPGDILSSRKIRDAERRLKAAQIFKNDPASGVSPRVVVRPVDEEVALPYKVRGQNPGPFYGAQPDNSWNQADRLQAGPTYAAQPNTPNYGSYPHTVTAPNTATPGSGDHRRFGWEASGQQIQPNPYQAPNGAAVAVQQTQQASPLSQYIGPTYQAPAGPPTNTLPVPNESLGLRPGNSPPVPAYPPGPVDQGIPTPGAPVAGPAYPDGSYLQAIPRPNPGFGNAAMLPPPPYQLSPNMGPQTSIPADIDILLEEAQTGRFMFGVGVNSDAGVIGNVVVDERNFDLFRPPRSWQDFSSGRVFRGRGQQFRFEALPGSRVQRYSMSLTEPYLLGTQVSSNISGYYFERRFFDWDEGRYGGRLGFGYRLGPDLSVALNGRAEQVKISSPRTIGAAPQLDAAIGEHDVFSGRVSLSHDTRDIAFAPTEGHLIELSYEQVFGSFDYPRGTIDYRRYFLVHERPDYSGRHTLGFSFRVGASGSDTPIFENFFAGGFSTLRGFDFRGASPVVNSVIVGGQFQFIGSVEYMFPLTADDMLRGVVFVDYGTVEQDIEINAENFRVAPGFGLRISVPAMGPAPIALDFAFPVADASTDDRQVFSFFIGMTR